MSNRALFSIALMVLGFFLGYNLAALLDRVDVSSIEPSRPTVEARVSTMVASNTPGENTLTVNGVVIKGGQTIVVRDGRVVVDGKDVTPDAKEITITVNGTVEQLTADVCNQISVTGDTGNISTQTGNGKSAAT